MGKFEELYKRNYEQLKEVVEKVQEKAQEEYSHGITPTIDRIMIGPTLRPEHFKSKFLYKLCCLYYFLERIKNYILRRQSPWQNWLENKKR